MISEIYNQLVIWGKRERFQPGFLSIFLNPFFFIRRGLYKCIKDDAKDLDGLLLDFGCGRKPYKNLFTVKKYIGLDMKQTGHSHELSEVDVYYDGKTIPFNDEYFDSIFCSEVIEHVFEVDSVFNEINRVLKKGGKMLLTVPFVWNEHEVPYDYGRYSTYGITYLLEKHGFEVIKISKSTNFVETICQLWVLYLHHVLKTKYRLLNTIFNVFFISPFTILGLIVSSVLPRRFDLYHNCIIVAIKE